MLVRVCVCVCEHLRTAKPTLITPPPPSFTCVRSTAVQTQTNPTKRSRSSAATAAKGNDNEDDDDFGMRDSDWLVYSEIVRALCVVCRVSCVLWALWAQGVR